MQRVLRWLASNSTMHPTLRNLLIFGMLGSGVGLSVSGERRLGFLVEMGALGLAVISFPRQTRKTLRAVPKSLARSGKAIGKAVAKAGKAISQAAA